MPKHCLTDALQPQTSLAVVGVLAELERARIKFPGEEEDLSPAEWLLVVMEEVGEVARAIQDGETMAATDAEMTQLCAMALRMLVSYRLQGGFSG